MTPAESQRVAAWVDPAAVLAMLIGDGWTVAGQRFGADAGLELVCTRPAGSVVLRVEALRNQTPAATKTFIRVDHKTMTAAVLVDDGSTDPSDETVPIHDVQRVILHFEDALFIPALITKLGRPASLESARWGGAVAGKAVHPIQFPDSNGSNALRPHLLPVRTAVVVPAATDAHVAAVEGALDVTVLRVANAE